MRLAWIWLATGIGACGSSNAGPDAGPPDARLVDAPAVIDSLRDDASVFPLVDLSDSPGRDEDPTLLRSVDGRLYFMWSSARSGNGDIYLRRGANGVDWNSAIRVTTSTDPERAPSLVQDAANKFHVAFERRSGGTGAIVYNSSVGGSAWSAASEVALTASSSGDGDAVPAIVQAASGALVVVFARNTCGAVPCFVLHAVRSTDGGTTWSVPAPVPGIATTGKSDHSPFLLRTGTRITLVWNRYVSAPGEELPALSETSEVMLSSSSDGLAWSAPIAVTSNDSRDLSPALYEDANGVVFATWLSAPDIAAPFAVEQPLSTLGVGTPTATFAVAGTTPRFIATAIAGRYVAAYVGGSDPELDVFAQAFTR